MQMVSMANINHIQEIQEIYPILDCLLLLITNTILNIILSQLILILIDF